MCRTYTYWLSACSLLASLRASRHWSLASLMAPQVLLTVTIFIEQFNSSESSCHFSTRLSPAHRPRKIEKKINMADSTTTNINQVLLAFLHIVSPCEKNVPWSMNRTSELLPLVPYSPLPTKVTSRLQRSFRLSYRAVSVLFIPKIQT